MSNEYADYAKMIDHSLLMPTMDRKQLEAGCQLAIAYDVASVCIMPYYLRRCTELLSGTTVQPSTTIGFPHGGHTTAAKQREAEIAIEDGCQELDMVVNISQVLSGEWDYVTQDIQAIPADAAFAAELQIDEGAPMLRIIRCYFNAKGKVFEISVSHHAGDRFAYSMHIDVDV